MKRLLTSFLFITIIFSLTIFANAAEMNTYRLDELEMSIDIPSYLMVYTRDISEDDLYMSRYGLNRDDLLDILESNNVYLDAYPQDVGYEILVTMASDEDLKNISDFNKVTDSDIMEFSDILNSLFASYGATSEDAFIYSNSQTKFLVFKWKRTANTGDASMLSYYTVVNGMIINITLRSYIGEITSSMESVMKTIVDGTNFDSHAALSKNPITYYNPEARVGFTVPAGWGEKEPYNEWNTIKVKYVNNEGNSMLFGFSDIWGEMPDADKEGIIKEDLNNSLFYRDDISSLYEDESSTVVSVEKDTINNTEYFKVVRSIDTEFGKFIMHTYVKFYDGVMYEFDFSGDEGSAEFDDFKSVLSSVKYDNIETDSLGIDAIILFLLFTIVIFSLPIIIYRFAIKKERLTKDKSIRITILYGIIGFVAVVALTIGNESLSIFSGAAVVFWSFINFIILSCGKAKSTPIAETAPLYNGFGQMPIPTGAKYCSQCGSPLEPGSVLCNGCGAKTAVCENTAK